MWKKENLRKNFLRVKQIADQNLGRAEKSEVLSEDQQGSDKRVDVIRHVTTNLIKKITALLEAPPGTDVEKRLKKLPETSLSHALIEASTLLGTDTLLGTICLQSGECESVIAREELQCELDIEKDVLTHLQYLAEIEIPTIIKLRKQLTKSTLDMDSAKTRFNTAVRQSHVPGANMAAAAAKADAVRDEYEEACNRVESIKDNLSIELCNFIAKESEHSSRLVALLEAQAAYHKKALKSIKEAIPKMKQTIEESANKPVFGMPLEEHLGKMGRDVAMVLEACILTLLDTGIEEEGLFRIAGSAIKLKKLRACFDAQAVDMEEFVTDPHTVAGVLKQYLRELPEPMLTFDLHPDFMRATQLPPDQRVQALKIAVNKLPQANYNNVRYLVKFLAVLAEKSSVNKMTPSNIAIVMGPNLLWAKGEIAPNMLTAGAVSAIVEAFIVNAEDFFPGEIDFQVTGSDSAFSEQYQEPVPASMSASSPAVITHSPSAVTSPGCIYPNINSLAPNTAPPPDSQLSGGDSPEGSGGQLSPKFHRRMFKKPAPPPPPERSYNVAVTASVGKTSSGNSGYATVPRPSSQPHQPPHHQPSSTDPLPDATSQPGAGEKQHPSPPERRTSGLERPHWPPPERPHIPPPDRPKPLPAPPSVLPQPQGTPGHQRSASTGAMYVTTINTTAPTSPDKG